VKKFSIASDAFDRTILRLQAAELPHDAPPTLVVAMSTCADVRALAEYPS
jgi:hypothetical protein